MYAVGAGVFSLSVYIFCIYTISHQQINRAVGISNLFSKTSIANDISPKPTNIDDLSSNVKDLSGVIDDLSGNVKDLSGNVKTNTSSINSYTFH